MQKIFFFFQTDITICISFLPLEPTLFPALRGNLEKKRLHFCCICNILEKESYLNAHNGAKPQDNLLVLLQGRDIRAIYTGETIKHMSAISVSLLSLYYHLMYEGMVVNVGSIIKTALWLCFVQGWH